MSISAQNSSRKRINALLDENSFVEVGGYITARATDFNLTADETPADGVITVSYTHLDVYKRQKHGSRQTVCRQIPGTVCLRTCRCVL